MQFEYTLTAEDLHEASKALNPGIQSRRMPWQVLNFLCAFAVLAFFAIPRVFSFNRNLGMGSGPKQNVWIAISPSLCMVTYLLLGFIVRPAVLRLQQRAGPDRKSAREKAAAIQLVEMLALLWIVPAVWPPLILYWTPTDGQELCAAFAPWWFYLAAVRFIAVRRHRKTIDKQWQISPGLKRPNVLEIDATGVVCGDGVVEYRVRWPGFKRYCETDNLLLLLMESGLAIFIPTRAVTDISDLDSIKMLIHDNISEGEFKMRRGAFPVIASAGAANNQT